jgi:hypothetical protein
MTVNLGEEIVAAYLQYIKGCEFIQQNLYTPDEQGEIDVVGIDLETRTIYVCEVAIHLITGMQYVKNNQPNNVNKLTEKFSRDIEYTKKYFPDYSKHYMLWSPIVKVAGNKAKFNQKDDIERITENVQTKYGVTLECIINKNFDNCLAELREYARKETKELKSPVLRFMQIEEYLKKHIGKTPYPVMKKENDLEKILDNFKEQVDLMEKSYNPAHLNLHFENLIRADAKLFKKLLSIGLDAWKVIKINQSWKNAYWFYDFFQLISRGSGRILTENSQKYVSKDVIIQLALLLVEISQMTLTPDYSGDITQRNEEALANLLLAFKNISNLRKMVLTRAKEMNDQNVINFATGAIEMVRRYEKGNN